MHPLFRLHLLAFPPACRQCGRLMNPLGAAGPGFPFLCAACHQGLPWKNPAHSCRQCGALTAEPSRRRCPMCAGRTYAFARAWGVLHYADPVRQWVWALKYGREEPLARMLGSMMAAPAGNGDGGPQGEADMVVPVPLHRKRLQHRGFNQSHLLAAAWRKALEAAGKPAPPLAPQLLVRHRHTQPQVEVAPQEREGNVAGAFSVPRGDAPPEPGPHPALAGQRVLLVDDLLTSGATLNACADALLQAGAARVEALVLARA